MLRPLVCYVPLKGWTFQQISTSTPNFLFAEDNIQSIFLARTAVQRNKEISKYPYSPLHQLLFFHPYKSSSFTRTLMNEHAAPQDLHAKMSS